MAGNGQRGAFSVSEETRISFTTQLRKLREDDSVEEVRFASTLDNIERKFLHHLAEQLGLISKSRGKGDARYITVFKSTSKKAADDDDADSLPVLTLGKDATDVLSAHVGRYRISDEEREMLGAGGAGAEATHRAHSNTDAARRLLRKSSSASAKDADKDRRLRDAYASALQRRLSNPKYRSIVDGRKRLPAWSHAETVARLVRENQVVIISGDTGCGKSTQVPQFILDDPEVGPSCRMAVTQPRRISAIAVAERIASERLEDVGKSIGYNIRLESEVSDLTQVTFMTPGVLLRKLASDTTLSSYTHIVIDEVHERDRNTDFLLIVLRDLLPSRPELRVILMSATLQSDKLAVYFSACPVATIGSTVFPVQEFYLEDVLLQTDYVKPTAGNKSDSLLRALCQSAKPVYTCAMCNRKGFRSPEEYGTHVVLCDGGGKGSSSVDYRALELRLLRDLQDGGDTGPQYDDGADWFEPHKPLQPTPDEFEEAQGQDEEDTPFRHEPQVGGIFVMPKATEVQAQDVLRAYQFNWDDDMVDYNLIRDLLKYICESGYEQGAVLVFLPGWDDISRLRDLMRRDQYFGSETRFLVLPLHSGIPSKMQREVFKRPPPGCRKIVLATNIAETSITIDDVAFVVDSCRVKEKTYDPYLKMCMLSATWISKASARQRKGRAGRTTAGVCFHLCSKRRYEALREFRDSELLTTPLEELVLQAKALGLAPGGPSPSVSGGGSAGGGPKKDDTSVTGFLMKAMDPPHSLAIRNALELLQQIGALTPEEQLTELGWKLANMPMDPRIGKMVLWGQLLGCGKSALRVGCAMAYRDPFVLPLSSDQKQRAERAKQELADATMSDHLALVNALNAYEKAIEKGGISESIHFCDRYFLSRSTLATVLDVTRQMVSEMGGLGFESPFRKGPANEHDNNMAVLAAVIGAGLYPGVARRQRGETNFVTVCKKKAKIHQGSVNAFTGSRFTRTCASTQPEFMVFSEVLRTPQVYLMSNTTPVAGILLFLLCGTLKVRGTAGLLRQSLTPASTPRGMAPPSQDDYDDDDDDEDDGQAVLNMDDWISFRCAPELAVQVQLLRLRLQQAFVQFIRQPQSRLSEVHQDAIRAAVKILTLENMYIPTRLKDGQQGGAPVASGVRAPRPQQQTPKPFTSYPTMPQGMRGGGKPMQQPRGEGAGGRGYVHVQTGGGGYGGGRGGDRSRRGAPPPPRAPGDYSNRG